ncbi:MAG: hypothetical protein MSA20_00070 [Bacteroidales bacterium]|nr:hypothetical protein [Bacteroidales bacterium]
MRKIKIFLVMGLSLLLGNAAANAQTYVCSSTPVSETDGITSGMYIINVWAKGSQGLLYEPAANGYTGYVSTNTISTYSGQTIDTSNATMKKMLWNLEVQEDGSFTIQSASTFLYYSKMGAQAEGRHNVQRVSSNTDANIGHLALNTKVDISGVPFFTVRLANGSFEGNGHPTFFHVNGSGRGTTGETFHLGYWELGENTGLNTGAGDSGVLLSFYKLEIQNPVNFSYVYRVNGSEIYRQSKTVTEGDAYPDLATAPAFCQATKPEGTVSASLEGQEVDINVTWSAPVGFSTLLKNAKWCLMTAGKANDVLPVMRYKEGQDYITLKTTDKDFTLSSADQWAFVGNPYEGFKIYNRFNKGRLISSTTMSSYNGRNTNPYVSTGELPSGYTELWDLHVQQVGNNQSAIGGGFSISQHGQSSYKMNKRGFNDEASDPRLAYWTTGADNGSTFTATQVLPSSLITYNSFESNGYTTLYVDYPIEVTNAKVYTGQRNDAQTSVEMTLATDNIIPANTGVVLVREGLDAVSNQTYTISNVPGTVAKGDISGTTTAIALTDDTRNNYRVFGLSNASPQSLGFFRPSSRVPSIPANKAFFDLTGSGVQGFVLSFDGTETGIALEQIMQPRPEADKPAYDLSGRRVNHAAKGIYIIGGRKVIVK